jgi:hypothetical protein
VPGVMSSPPAHQWRLGFLFRPELLSAKRYAQPLSGADKERGTPRMRAAAGRAVLAPRVIAQMSKRVGISKSLVSRSSKVAQMI